MTKKCDINHALAYAAHEAMKGFCLYCEVEIDLQNYELLERKNIYIKLKIHDSDSKHFERTFDLYKMRV